jgi:hypothetical protein
MKIKGMVSVQELPYEEEVSPVDSLRGMKVFSAIPIFFLNYGTST